MTIKIRLDITGITPLLCHNINLANPLDERSKLMKEYSGKKKKTDSDYEQMAKLDWYGGLYTSPGIEGPAFPTRSIRMSLIQGARLSRKGKDVERALNFEDMYVPLDYPGPRDIDELFESGQFANQDMVTVNGKKISRTRPQFPQWSLMATCYLTEDVANLRDIHAYAETAGRLIGVGDNRVNGYGKYNVVIEAL